MENSLQFSAWIIPLVVKSHTAELSIVRFKSYTTNGRRRVFGKFYRKAKKKVKSYTKSKNLPFVIGMCPFFPSTKAPKASSRFCWLLLNLLFNVESISSQFERIFVVLFLLLRRFDFNSFAFASAFSKFQINFLVQSPTSSERRWRMGENHEKSENPKNYTFLHRESARVRLREKIFAFRLLSTRSCPKSTFSRDEKASYQQFNAEETNRRIEKVKNYYFFSMENSYPESGLNE